MGEKKVEKGTDLFLKRIIDIRRSLSKMEPYNEIKKINLSPLSFLSFALSFVPFILYQLFCHWRPLCQIKSIVTK